jgi:hypothetical protein
MLFKKKGSPPQKDEIIRPAPTDSEPAIHIDPASEKDTAADESKNLKRIDTDTIYPSGLKLALLMTSMFVGMFLVALVRSKLQIPLGACAG